MKIRITYSADVTVEIDPAEVAEGVDGGSDEEIQRAIRESAGEAAAEREWPAFRVDARDMQAATVAVRRAIAESEE